MKQYNIYSEERESWISYYVIPTEELQIMD